MAELVALAHSSRNIDKLKLWHRQLGHLYVKSVKALRGMVLGVELLLSHVKHSLFICEGCIESKQKRLPFLVEGATHATKQLEIVHCNLCRSMKTRSHGGTKYFVTFLDDFSRKI